MLVGITHSSYRPIDNRFVIEEEFEVLVAKATAITDPFEQAFFLLVHLPYLQTFADANKRTSRIASNIPLLKVRQLVEAGEQVAVIDFLHAMANKSVADRDLLLAAAEDVRNGQLPARLFERV